MNYETVLHVEHHSERLFSFKTTRQNFEKPFIPGQFTMIGMGDDDVLRAYSIASAPHQDTLEFFSIKVDDGPLTSRLQHIKVGDEIEVGNRPTGPLVVKNLIPGKRLWCLATGTGLAPFLSIVRDPETLGSFDQVIVTHTVRHVRELAFRELLESLPVVYYPSVTREPFERNGRITALVESGQIFNELNLSPWNIEEDRIMICGSPEFNADLRRQLESKGFVHGTNRTPGHFVQERAFVTQHPGK